MCVLSYVCVCVCVLWSADVGFFTIVFFSKLFAVSCVYFFLKIMEKLPRRCSVSCVVLQVEKIFLDSYVQKGPLNPKTGLH